MAWEMDSDRPIYTQILEKIQTMIICGVYKPGDKLPSVRELAALANVNPNTMQRALSELERSGLILTQRNSGRTVTSDTDIIGVAKHEIALKNTQEFLKNMREIGFSDSEITSIINETLGGGQNIE